MESSTGRAHARAHGKVILLGEHAVVYGYPALAAGIECGATATAEWASAACLRVGEHRFAPGETDVGRAFAALLEALGSPEVAVRVDLELPPGLGLGASAAMGVAVARAITELMAPRGARLGPDEALVMTASVAWERVFHGNPSGIDTAAAARGGCIEFTRLAGSSAVTVAEPLALAVALAGPPSSTRAMVEALAARRSAEPALVERRLEAIGSLVRRGRAAVELGELDVLGELMDRNQEILAELGTSTPELDRACELARRSSALGAKLTGSGGGGCVIALARSSPQAILDAWKAVGIDCFATRVVSASEGLRP